MKIQTPIIALAIMAGLTHSAKAQSSPQTVAIRVSIPDFAALKSAQDENAVSTFRQTGNEPSIMIGLPDLVIAESSAELVVYSRSDAETTITFDSNGSGDPVQIRERDSTATQHFVRQVYLLDTAGRIDSAFGSAGIITFSAR